MTDAMTTPITLLRGESIKDKTIVVWFSCGAASAVAAKLAVDMYGADNNVMIVNNPIKEEHPDNLRFKRDVEKWLGVEIIDAINPKFPNHSIVEVFDKDSNGFYFSLAQEFPACDDYNAAYKPCWDDDDNLVGKFAPCPIEACVQLIEWLTSNGYKLNEQ